MQSDSDCFGQVITDTKDKPGTNTGSDLSL